MNTFSPLGYETRDTQLVINSIINTVNNVIIIKKVYFHKALTQNKLNKSLETSNEYKNEKEFQN